MTTSTWKRYRGVGVPGGVSNRRGELGNYLADEKLVAAVNTALAVGRPLLITGEPGCGKTVLAWSVAGELGLGEVLAFHTRSDHQARDVLYTFDHLQRFYHAQVQDPMATQPERYVRWQPLGEAIRSGTQRLVLIDEIDKAPRDFPNDLLDEIDAMAFDVPEFGWSFTAQHRPVVIITSNSERQLPDPFLRRCVFHHIEFPSRDLLKRIVLERLGGAGVAETLVDAALRQFLAVRDLPGLEKKPATAELIMWTNVLHQSGFDAQELSGLSLAQLPYRGALIKSVHDASLADSTRR